MANRETNAEAIALLASATGTDGIAAWATLLLLAGYRLRRRLGHGVPHELDESTHFGRRVLARRVERVERKALVAPIRE